jgi:hypothetical protein
VTDESNTGTQINTGVSKGIENVHESSVSVPAKPGMMIELLNYVTNRENRNQLIHMVSDVILFYFCFSYINQKFQTTESHIENVSRHLTELKRQYGIGEKVIERGREVGRESMERERERGREVSREVGLAMERDVLRGELVRLSKKRK